MTKTGWAPAHTDFAEGLAATIDWYAANEAWWRPAKEATEAKYAAQGQLGSEGKSSLPCGASE